jgi:hypothetical protein
LDDRILGRNTLNRGVDSVPLEHHGVDDPAGQFARRGVAFGLGEVAFQHGRGRALAEVRLEHRRQGEPASGAPRPDAIVAIRLARR